MKTKFTKGEWHVEAHHDADNCYYISSEKSVVIATAWQGRAFKNEAEHNAKLMAESPELLTRLNRLVLSVKAHPDYQFGEEGDEWHDIVSLAEEAIKKATE